MAAQSRTRDGEETTAEAGVIRRTPGGWSVQGEQVPDLVNAMVLADILAAEQQRVPEAPPAPPRAGDDATEVERLRITVAQLEHALQTRVVVEQAIGVLAERHRLAPREAFEKLRSAARSRGRKVADLSRDVVASCTNPLTPLPAELAGAGTAAEAAGGRA
ncbi:ANTAR domain-containing protein [Nocardiopsis suaedae]|uniref:ANTAR domain-containing protein n=1 Tax=Nocardiopsis suaedae TaxID=3018444 RepID=A0ABT4TUV7_9ACTN|nr:ANTAR domain-containing protein [Nocardiopsis suaedae]MDA2808487.1 ANTAR domain-containing protein [Nocardiopsis suaedae]